LASLAIVPVRTIGTPNFGFRAAIVLGTVLAIAPKPVLAEVQVRGSPEAVRIEVRDAPVEEILAVLSRTFGLHYQLSANLDKRLSGTYAGPLPRVVTRILDGYNFVLKTDNGSIAVTVLGTPDAPGAISASSSPRVVRPPGAAAPAAQPAHAVDDRARPAAAASTAAPSPAIELAKGSPFPTPALSTSRDAPAPVPQEAQSGAPAPAPPALGSAATPAPQPGSFAGTPPPAAGPTPLSVPPRAQ